MCIRCRAVLVPAEDCRATEYTLVVEITRLCLHSTVLALSRVPFGVIAVPSTGSQ